MAIFAPPMVSTELCGFPFAEAMMNFPCVTVSPRATSTVFKVRPPLFIRLCTTISVIMASICPASAAFDCSGALPNSMTSTFAPCFSYIPSRCAMSSTALSAMLKTPMRKGGTEAFEAVSVSVLRQPDMARKTAHTINKVFFI